MTETKKVTENPDFKPTTAPVDDAPNPNEDKPTPAAKKTAKKTAEKPEKAPRYAAYDTAHQRFIGAVCDTKKDAQAELTKRQLSGDRYEIRSV